jgi:hypothetical protein
MRFHQSLRVFSGISTAHADRQHLGDRFRQAEQIRHRRKRTAQVIRVEPRDNHLLADIGQVGRDIRQSRTEEVRLVDPHYLRPRIDFGRDLFGAGHHF